MTFTMQALTHSLADYLAPAMPGFTFYDNPNQQGTKTPAMFFRRTRAKITKRLGGRFLRQLGLDLVCLVEYDLPDMEDQYTAAADVLDERLDTFPYSSGEGGESVLLRRLWEEKAKDSAAAVHDSEIAAVAGKLDRVLAMLDSLKPEEKPAGEKEAEVKPR